MKGSTVIRLIAIAVVLGVGWWYFLRPADKGPWTITVVDGFRYAGEAVVGGDISMTVPIRNSGSGASNATKLQISDIRDYADLASCVPECTITFGPDAFATLPGVAAGATQTFTVKLVAKKPGAPHWTVCVYDAAAHGEQVYCGSATTVIR